MNLLLDTHTFLWMSLDDHSSARRRGRNCLASRMRCISALLCIGRLRSKYRWARPNLSNAKLSNHLTLLPIGVDHAAEVSTLPFHHKDPFDRMLIAQSMVENFPIVGCDPIFDQYGVARIW